MGKPRGQDSSPGPGSPGQSAFRGARVAQDNLRVRGGGPGRLSYGDAQSPGVRAEPLGPGHLCSPWMGRQSWWRWERGGWRRWGQLSSGGIPRPPTFNNKVEGETQWEKP